jgi:hypothetical protein
MTDYQWKVVSLAIIALVTILYVYAPWRPKKKCPTCGIKVDREIHHCPKCDTALL